MLLAVAVCTVSLMASLTACNKKQAANATPANETGEWKPSGTVTMIVAYKAGSGTDNTARVLTSYAEKYVGQHIVIDTSSEI